MPIVTYHQVGRLPGQIRKAEIRPGEPPFPCPGQHTGFTAVRFFLEAAIVRIQAQRILGSSHHYVRAVLSALARFLSGFKQILCGIHQDFPAGIIFIILLLKVGYQLSLTGRKVVENPGGFAQSQARNGRQEILRLRGRGRRGVGHLEQGLYRDRRIPGYAESVALSSGCRMFPGVVQGVRAAQLGTERFQDVRSAPGKRPPGFRGRPA